MCYSKRFFFGKCNPAGFTVHNSHDIIIQKRNQIIIMLQWLNILLLSIIEGLTEFIPVSSTGHLIIFESFAKLNFENTESFHIAIQIGAITAIVFSEKAVFKAWLKPQYWLSKDSLKVLSACLPALLMGFILKDYVKLLFSPFSVSMALITGGILMIITHFFKQEASKNTQNLSSLSFKQCISIGFWQCLALWPGFSRSGATIMGGIWSNCSYLWAARFSFIIGVPIISAAVAYELLSVWHHLSQEELIAIAAGIILSFVFGHLGIMTVLRVLKQFRLLPFAIYRIGVGSLCLFL